MNELPIKAYKELLKLAEGYIPDHRTYWQFKKKLLNSYSGRNDQDGKSPLGG